MLSAFYNALFGSREAVPSSRGAGVGVGLLACVILAFNAAGQLHWGVLGLLLLVWIFSLLGALGLYWYTASVHLLAAWLIPTRPTAPPMTLNVLQGFWPLALLGPAVALQQWWPSLGIGLTLFLLLGTGLTLTAAIRQTYGMPWISAALCMGLTLALGLLALLGLLGWPMMFLLGIKHFNM